MLGPAVRSGRPDHLPPAEPGLRSEAARSAHAGNRPNEKPPVTIAEQRFAEIRADETGPARDEVAPALPLRWARQGERAVQRE